MPKMHLRQPGFTYSLWGPFTKNKERIQKFKETRIHDIFMKTNWIKLDDDYQKTLSSRVYKFFDKKTSGGATMLANKSAVKNENISNKELA